MAYNATNPNGQTTMANSTPITLASDQSVIRTKLSNDVAAATGTITSSTSIIAPSALTGVGSATVTVSGTYAGVTVVFEGSLDNANWIGVPAQALGTITPVPMLTAVLTTNAYYMWNIAPLLGIQYFRVRATAWTSGTANVTIQPSAQFTQPIVNVGSGVVNTTVSNDATVNTAFTASGTLTTATLTGAATASIQVTGTWAGTLTPQASVDGVNFVTISGTPMVNLASGSYANTIASGVQSVFQIDVSGFVLFRMNMAWTSGTATVTIKTSAATGMVALDTPLPTGSNTIGAVTGTVTANVTSTGGIIGINPTLSTTGLTVFSNLALTNTVVAVKTTAARMHEYDFYNPNSSGVWIQLFNLATGSVTLGTTAPTRAIYLPATSGRDWTSPYSDNWSTALSIACTTTNNGSTAPASSIQSYIGYL